MKNKKTFAHLLTAATEEPMTDSAALSYAIGLGRALDNNHEAGAMFVQAAKDFIDGAPEGDKNQLSQLGVIEGTILTMCYSIRPKDAGMVRCADCNGLMPEGQLCNCNLSGDLGGVA
jgi:hypothetical protein